jgi:hypothetical protein
MVDAMTIQQFIVDYIRRHRSVTFSELQKAGQQAGYSTHGRMELADGDAFLWSAMSEEFVVAVRNLLDNQQIRIVETTKLDCLVASPTIIVSKDRWIPCRLEAT